MLSRSELREKAMTIIYQISLYKKNKMEFDVDSVIKENLEVDNEFVKDLVYGVITSYDELGELANKYLKNWTIDRLDMTGASILRIALYEIKYMDTPDVVVINEAVELAKKYSDDDVKNMINAVLDKVIND
ncbi:MAG: transcription antitermination factor NusB [bacterium]|nr:transcription antitermination factor NusB [bacterium]